MSNITLSSIRIVLSFSITLYNVIFYDTYHKNSVTASIFYEFASQNLIEMVILKGKLNCPPAIEKYFLIYLFSVTFIIRKCCKAFVK